MSESLLARSRAGARAVCTSRGALTLLGAALLAGWAALWAAGLSMGRLPGRTLYWFEPFDRLGLDFEANYQGPACRLAGGDPYRDLALGPFADRYAYPPALLWLFAWAPLLPLRAAALVWLAASVLIAAAGAWAAVRTRARLGLWRVPGPLALAAVLCSTPVLFALERGNCDLLIVLFILFASWALARRTRWGDVLAGAVLALAACGKLYPAALLAVFVVDRRWLGLAAALATAALIVALDVPGTLAFRDNIAALVHKHAPGLHGWYHPSVHSLGGWWDVAWQGTRFQGVFGRVKGTWLAGGLLAALVGWVSWRLFRSPGRGPLTFAYLAWLAAAATFLPAVANDYNLVFLPLAALAVWDKRDPVWVHGLMAFLLLWQQPVALPVGATLLFVFKLAGLAAVGVCLTRRARERPAREAPGSVVAPPTLAA
jgi:hypothetical protein